MMSLFRTKPARATLLVAVAILSLGTAALAAAQGDPQPGFLGVRLSEADGQVVIEAVLPGTAAESAGLAVGDVIEAINGESVTTAAEASAAVGTLAAGDTVLLDVLRGSERLTIEAVLGERPAVVDPRVPPLRERRFEMPDMERMPGMGFMSGCLCGGGRLGVTFVTLDEQSAAEHGVSVTEGALLLAVDEDSPAFEAGLQAGDVITAVAGEPVDAKRTLRVRLIAYDAGDVVSLSVLRGEETLSVDVTLGEPVGTANFFMPFERGGSPRELFRFFDDLMPPIGESRRFGIPFRAPTPAPNV